MSKQLQSILTLIDTVIVGMQSLRRAMVLQDRTVRDLLCGEWMQEGSHVSFRIWKESERYMIETRFSNDVNGHMKIFTGELLEDPDGNLFVSPYDRAIGYDKEKDCLRAEAFGVFERQKHPSDER